MYLRNKALLLLMLAPAVVVPAGGGAKKQHLPTEKKVETTDSLPAVLWRNPSDIQSRNLFYGPGGKAHQPQGVFTFVKEDLDGSNPKFDVKDESGVKWKVKLGEEAQPETAASRLVWAAGYRTNEDYFLEDLRVLEMPAHLKRGQKLIAPGGSVHAVRLKRNLKGEEKLGSWRWRSDPFTGTRELNGLRVIMALINNWDLKDENNTVYEEPSAESGNPVRVYMVSDLGASFGTAGPTWPRAKARGNLRSYSDSKFIHKLTPDFVDFQDPARPSFQFLVNLPQYFRRLDLRWIGRDIPRADARWMGQLLSQLSPQQIRDAFRASGYSTEEVEGFATVVQNRIAELKRL